jgi:F-type H+-transporting ATPase subunit c
VSAEATPHVPVLLDLVAELLERPDGVVVDATLGAGGHTAAILGALGPALAEGRAVAAAMEAIARQPEAANTISRTLFVGLAMIETTAIYCLVIALLLLFANPMMP